MCFSPVNSALLVVTVEDKVVYQSELNAGSNEVSLKKFPIGRYEATFEIKVGNKVYEKNVRTIINNSKYNIRTGDHYYSLFGYRYNKDIHVVSSDLSDDSSRTITEDGDVYGVDTLYRPYESMSISTMAATDFDNVIYLNGIDYYYDENISGGIDYSLINNELSAYSADISIMNSIRLSYTDTIFQNKEGFLSDFSKEKGESVSISASKRIGKVNGTVSYSSTRGEDSSSDLFSASVSSNFKSFNITVGGRYSEFDYTDSSGNKTDDYSIYTSINIPFGDYGTSNFYYSKSKNYDDYNVEHSSSFQPTDKMNVNASAGYKGGDSHNSPFLRMSASSSNDYIGGTASVYHDTDRTSSNLSLSGSLYATKNNVGLTNKSSHTLLIANEDEANQVIVSTFQDGAMTAQKEIKGRTVQPIDKYTEYQFKLSSGSDKVLLNSPTSFSYTSGLYGIFEIEPDAYKVSMFYGYSKSKEIECDECSEFQVDEFGYFFGKARAGREFNLKTKNICSTEMLEYSEFIKNIGEVKCQN